ncbi:DUF1766-domain-containing protein [Aaosphaeria arxii CBS 175.79]|uniref:DUF1766-domain-containing protein n=1 Tax=Aaosphaeria arxii CBS 175.79 TaxID=1450172 RepID=A0A6A5XI63_9PLEO|nr:DUF1766-domain-containing protein [Aaosphaeria arxii CBS 175.79]KAF2012460.1 DUF1766-domain-containing protein [Aaosphaeria arxii CBS 175.79]
MAFTGQTPEALLARSDSKNAATTCKGITKLGRPCRNPLDLDAIRNATGDNGVLAVTSVVGDSDDEEEIGAAAFFCWRHKVQAEQLGLKRQNTQIFKLQNRSSIDTLVAKLGVLEVNEEGRTETQEERRRRREQRRQSGAASSKRPPRRINRPPTWDRVQGPLMSVPSDVLNQRPPGRTQPQQQKKKKQSSFWSSLCCGTADDDDYVEVVRHKKRTDRQNPPPLISYIPHSLPPQTAAALLSELSKPISPHDDEGYIYIFWLTPESSGPAPSTTASTLLAPPTRPDQGRRTSDVLRQYSVRNSNSPTPRPRRRSNVTANAAENTPTDAQTILLKIGRANNVHRRMNEWTRQCGYALSLVRFYPYVSSTPSPSPQASPSASRRTSYQRSASGGAINNGNGNLQRPQPPHHASSSSSAQQAVRKVPHAHRVERLIHIELGAKRVVKKCDACGKDHREWFEVEASREGVKGVDEVVRRWVGWAEGTVGS